MQTLRYNRQLYRRHVTECIPSEFQRLKFKHTINDSMSTTSKASPEKEELFAQWFQDGATSQELPLDYQPSAAPDGNLT